MRSGFWIFYLVLLGMLLQGCGMIPIETEGLTPSTLPRFIEHDIVSLNQIEKISKFRSREGHDYSDGFENNRSMKHYYQPYASVISNQQSVSVYSPVDGTVMMVQSESSFGAQVRIIPRNYPYITIVLFHIYTTLTPGASVSSGQLIGRASVEPRGSYQSVSNFDVAVWTSSGRLVSWFDIMSDSIFSSYQARGATSRGQFMISKEVADTSTHNFGNSVSSDWVFLN